MDVIIHAPLPPTYVVVLINNSTFTTKQGPPELVMLNKITEYLQEYSLFKLKSLSSCINSEPNYINDINIEGV